MAGPHAAPPQLSCLESALVDVESEARTSQKNAAGVSSSTQRDVDVQGGDKLESWLS